MIVSLTVGKVDAGVAVLLTEDKRLIEFPSILLPPSISSGSIVDITVSRNRSSEAQAAESFSALQQTIYNTYGVTSPSPPTLRCRNATQTSIVLEWDPLSLATAELRSLSLFRNGSKAGIIPSPLQKHSTKISGLAVNTEYIFHLVLKTSAGTYSSQKLSIKTHAMTNLTGITITPGMLPNQIQTSLQQTTERIGARWAETVRIDTTHFVTLEGRGLAWEKASEMNIPIVQPEWLEACEREGRIVGVRGYYLNAKPEDQARPGSGLQQQQQQQRPERPGLHARMSQQTRSRENVPTVVVHGAEGEGEEKPLPSAPGRSEGEEESEEDGDEEGEGSESGSDEDEEERAEPKIAEGAEGKAIRDDMKPALRRDGENGIPDRTRREHGEDEGGAVGKESPGADGTGTPRSEGGEYSEITL